MFNCSMFSCFSVFIFHFVEHYAKTYLLKYCPAISKLKKHEQEQDIKTSIEFLKTAGHSLKNLTMCFPYGDFNKDTLTILKKYDFCLGFGIETRVANISKDNILTLPRLDTNDIPMFMDQPNRWYEEA